MTTILKSMKRQATLQVPHDKMANAGFSLLGSPRDDWNDVRQPSKEVLPISRSADLRSASKSSCDLRSLSKSSTAPARVRSVSPSNKMPLNQRSAPDGILSSTKECAQRAFVSLVAPRQGYSPLPSHESRDHEDACYSSAVAGSAGQVSFETIHPSPRRPAMSPGRSQLYPLVAVPGTDRSKDTSPELRRPRPTPLLTPREEELAPHDRRLRQSPLGGANHSPNGTHVVTHKQMNCVQHDMVLSLKTTTRKEYVRQLVDVESDAFSMTIGFFIAANTVVIGCETDFREQAHIWAVCEHIFCIVFLMEAILRIYELKEEYYWSFAGFFDLFLVISSVLDLWIFPMVAGQRGPTEGIVKSLRILKIVRVLRVIRLFRFFNELAVIASGFIKAVEAVAWVATIIMLMMWTFAVVTTRTVGHKAGEIWYDDKETADLVQEWYGTIPQSMYTLFKVFTLNEWVPMCDTVMARVSWFSFFMVGYIMLSSYTMASLVTAVISENMIAAVVEDEQRKLQDVVAENRRTLEGLASVFYYMDMNGQGFLGTDYLKAAVTGDPEIVKRLEILDIVLNEEEVDSVFNVTWPDHCADPDLPVTLEEFMVGFSKLRGAARAKDIVKFHGGLSTFAHNLQSIEHAVSSKCTGLQSKLETASSRVQSLQNSVASELRGLHTGVNGVDQRVAELERKLASGSADVHQRLESLEDKLESKCEQMTTKLDLVLSMLRKQSDEATTQTEEDAPVHE